MGDGAVRTRRWTRVEYDRLVEAEILGPEDRIELLGGELVVKEPQHGSHSAAILLVMRALARTFGSGWTVRPQLPVALDDESEPEPDVSVVRGEPRDYPDHPSHAALVVEVAFSRLGFDRERKGSLYARAGIADYWIVNLPDRCLEVYREPVPDTEARSGWRYGQVTTIAADGAASPLAVPGASVPVADLLP
ncbi:MAG: Uma2 family endonuclease [Candidatus Rokuibacteriota bacterium]